MTPHDKRHRWTPAEVERLRYLRDKEALSWSEIAADLGIETSAKCAAKYHDGAIRKRGEASKGPVRLQASTEMLIERELREAARERRSLTGHFCGDPPVGFSALDRRRSA